MDVTSITASRTLVQPNSAPAATARASAQDTPPPALAAAKNVATPAQKPNDSELQQAVDKSNKVLESKTSNELHFAIEKGTGISVVKLISRQSGDTILQFPSEAMLQIAKGIDQITGAIIQRKA